MKIQTFVTGIIGTNTYVLYDENTKEAVLVDPAACPKKLMNFIQEEGLDMKAVLLTHGHFDHIMGIQDFRKVYDVPVYAGEREAALLQDAHWNQSDIYTNGYTFSDAVYVKDGEMLHIAGFDIQVFFTPGHTPGGVCYYLADEGILFSGDTLFHHSVGRTDLREEACQIWYAGLRKSSSVFRMRRKSCLVIWMRPPSEKRKNTIRF